MELTARSELNTPCDHYVIYYCSLMEVNMY